MNILAEELKSAGLDGVELPNLSKAFDTSASAIERARSELKKKFPEDTASFDIVAFGSLARYELTTESDLDYLAVSYGLDPRPGAARRALDVADTLRNVISESGQELRAPGATGIFGQLVSAPDIVEVIGLQHDTNHSHTRRILLLEESVSLLDEKKHRSLIETMIRRYLEAKPISQTRVPRFLLNDLARYWRTLTIDYQAKSDSSSPYSLRYLKLILSRKFTFASSVLPLLLLDHGTSRDDGDQLVGKLADLYQLPPVIRFARCASLLTADAPELESALADCLTTIDTFNGLLGDKSWREQIAVDAGQEDVKVQPTFADARALGQSLQVGLESIFFHERLLPMTKSYMVF